MIHNETNDTDDTNDTKDRSDINETKIQARDIASHDVIKNIQSRKYV
jgi:hypothetical protein